MRTLRMSGFLCAAAFTALRVSAQSSVTVSYSATMPTENVLTSFAPSSGTAGLSWRDDTSNPSRELGQSFFVASNAVMGSFSVQANGNIQNGATEAPFTVTIYESATDTILGTVVSTQSGLFLNKDLNPISLGWITFDIESINLVAGNYYTFILSWDNASVASQSQGLNHRTAGDEYPAGRLWQSNGGAAPVGSSASDLAFCVQHGSSKTLRLIVIGTGL